MDSQFKLFVNKMLLFIIPVLLLFEGFYLLKIYPNFSNSSIFDAKMIQLQQSHVKRIDLILTGSSVASFGIKDSIMVHELDTSYYDLSSWTMQTTDVLVLTRKWVHAYKPKYLVLCSAPSDFRLPQHDTYASFVNTNEFIKKHFLQYFYFSNYHSISQLIRRKYINPQDTFTQWGGTSWRFYTTVKEWQVWRDVEDLPTSNASSNYLALDSLAALLSREKIKFIFIQTPMSKAMTDTKYHYQLMANHFNKCRSIVENQGGVYLNYYNPARFPDSLIHDKVHLTAQGATMLTQTVVKDLKGIIK